MFIQFFQFWYLRFAFLGAVILMAFALTRCLAWIMNGKYRSLPVLGWLVQRGMPLNHSVYIVQRGAPLKYKEFASDKRRG